MKSIGVRRRIWTALTLVIWASSGHVYAQQADPANRCGFHKVDWTPQQGSLHYTVESVGKSEMDHGRAISVGDSLTVISGPSSGMPRIDLKLQHFKIDKSSGASIHEISQKLTFRFREEQMSYRDYDNRRYLMGGGLRVVKATCGKEGKVDQATLQLFDDYMAMKGESEIDVLQDAILVRRSAQVSTP